MEVIQEDHIIKKTGSRQLQWVLDDVINDDTNEYDSDFIEEFSNDSSLTLSSSEMDDDAMSSSSSTSSSVHEGPLYEFSELMAHLPLKRGLSKYYQGKSESFGSLANFKNIEDLAKKRSHTSTTSRCKSQSQTFRPKGTIVKNKKSCSSIARSCLVSSVGDMNSILDTIVVQKRF